MIICFDCSPATKTALDQLVQTGGYPNASEALAVAVANLALLHQKLGRGEMLVVDGTANVAPRPTPGRPVTPQTSTDISDAEPPSKSYFARPTEPPAILAPMPGDAWMPGQNVPVNRWLFGQYNRLLPAKVNCRALAHLLKAQPKGVELPKAASLIVAAIFSFRAHLAAINRQYELDRDDALATGFPHYTDDKSRLRYANQFVASLNAKGQVGGLLIDLKLINHTQDKPPRLLLTEAGWQFAAMPNPIVEGATEPPHGRLTVAEQDFLLAHILKNVPAEAFAYRAIIKAVLAGATTPAALDAALASATTSTAPSIPPPSPPFLSSQRLGAVAHMCDLGLICRKRDGVRVSYVITDKAREIV